MAKKFVRGITDVKTINNQDFDTNNVNDLLSDGQYNYIHRKKGKTEEYHNLTDNIKTISSDNTDLLTVTNNNKTTNTATLHPKHDAQKEQVLESTRNTVTINHGTNGTTEKTTVDTNPQKVLEHEKLKTGDGLTTSFNNDETTIMFKATKKSPETNLSALPEGIIWGGGFSGSSPQGDAETSASYITIQTDTDTKVQLYIRESIVNHAKIILFYRFIKNGVATEWKQMVGDKSVIDDLLAQKEQVLESTRNTVTIHHGTNGTAEKTTVDTNPQKVLEHENLVSDSEYITLDHQTDVNKTHIKTESLKQELQQLHQTKQDTLTAGSGITIQGNTISASGGGETSTIVKNDFEGGNIILIEHVVTSGGEKLTTFSFVCHPQTSEAVMPPTSYKERIEAFIPSGSSVSNGAITITNDGTNIKVTNSNSTENVYQQGTFTFYGNGGGIV